MSLREQDVIDRLKQSLKEAIQASKDLAVRSREGQPYGRLRDNLLLIEGCCRQLAVFREDSTWLQFGVYAAELHKRAGGFLRGHTRKGVHIFLAPGELNQAFVTIAGQLTAVLQFLTEKAGARTGKRGQILPHAPQHRRTGAPSSNSGLILPASMRKRATG